MRTSALALSLASLTALACASTGPTRELLDARRAYETARAAPETRETPERVLEAKQALERAEDAHAREPGSFQEKSLAYVAERRAELALVYGRYAADRRARWTADAQYKVREDALRREAEKNAAETRRVLEGTRATLGTLEDNPGGEAPIREGAESRDDLRGRLVTFEDSALFGTMASELLPGARQKLDEVARALKDGAEGISVLDHTNSAGDAAANLRLSRERADAVRAYLVERGIAPDRIKAVGQGDSETVAASAGPRGRAAQGRVELVVQKRPTP
jgi:outer membrane protein OmpA-like peptidoglycan-associated protein